VTINRPPRDGRMAFVRSPDNISVELLQAGARWRRPNPGPRCPISATGSPRTVPATQLAQIESLTLRNQMLLQESLIDPDAARTVQRVAQIDQNIATVTSTWARYTSTYLTPKRSSLADQFAQVRGQFVAGGPGPDPGGVEGW
jgi:hypothetical protein